MKIETLKERKEFLQMQKSFISKNLITYIEKTKELAEQIENESDFIIDIEPEAFDLYIEFLCQSIETYCREYSESLLNHIVFSTHGIDINMFNMLFRTRYIFKVLRTRYRTQNKKTYMLADINTGEVYMESPENFVDISHSKHRRSYNYLLHNLKTTILSSCELFPDLKNVFRRPFRLGISMDEMDLYIVREKLDRILSKLNYIKDMSLPEILKLSSVEYYRKYRYNNLISLDELRSPNPEIQKMLSGFIENLDAEIRIPLLNFILCIAPGLIQNIDPHEYENCPYFYMLKWISNYKN